MGNITEMKIHIINYSEKITKEARLYRLKNDIATLTVKIVPYYSGDWGYVSIDIRLHRHTVDRSLLLALEELISKARVIVDLLNFHKGKNAIKNPLHYDIIEKWGD